MESTSTYAPKILTGINVIDEAWGGLYRGGSYLLYGQAWSGRSLLNLQFAYTGATRQERTLYIFPDRPRDLIIQAASIHFDLRTATENDLVKLMRIPPSFKPAEMSDEDLHKALIDLAEVAKQEEPDRLVIDSFSRFAQFENFEAFQDAFVEMLEYLELVDTTILFALGEPANENAQRVIEFMARQVTGSIHIDADADDPFASRRLITIVPNIGHLEGAVADHWDLSETIAQNERAQLMPAVPEEDEEQAEAEEEEEEIDAPLGLPASMLPRKIRTLSAIRAERERLRAELAKEAEAEAAERRQAIAAEQLRIKQEEEARAAKSTPPPFDLTATSVPADEEEDDEMDDVESVFSRSDVTPAPPPIPDIQAKDPTPSFADLARMQGTSSEVVDATNEAAFLEELQRQFAMRETEGHTFLLIAMRMNRGDGRQVRPFDFEFILDLVTDSLRSTDRMLVNHKKERLIVLRTSLENEGEDKDFFKSLTGKLQKEAPQQAEHLIQSVAALTVRDGKPFASAEEFLAYLDKS